MWIWCSCQPHMAPRTSDKWPRHCMPVLEWRCLLQLIIFNALKVACMSVQAMQHVSSTPAICQWLGEGWLQNIQQLWHQPHGGCHELAGVIQHTVHGSGNSRGKCLRTTFKIHLRNAERTTTMQNTAHMQRLQTFPACKLNRRTSRYAWSAVNDGPPRKPVLWRLAHCLSASRLHPVHHQPLQVHRFRSPTEAGR